MTASAPKGWQPKVPFLACLSKRPGQTPTAAPSVDKSHRDTVEHPRLRNPLECVLQSLKPADVACLSLAPPAQAHPLRYASLLDWPSFPNQSRALLHEQDGEEQPRATGRASSAPAPLGSGRCWGTRPRKLSVWAEHTGEEQTRGPHNPAMLGTARSPSSCPTGLNGDTAVKAAVPDTPFSSAPHTRC